MALQSLLINEDELDKDLLEEILKPYVRLGQDSGGVRFTPLATKLSIKEKVLYVNKHKITPNWEIRIFT